MRQPRAIQSDLRARAAEQVEALQKQHGAGMGASSVHFSEQSPWVALIQRVARGQADLVVVAKRNHGRRDDRKLGSVSMKLVRKCSAPVWLVKPEHPLKHRHIVAATDLLPAGDIATDYGAFLARTCRCELLIAHAWQVPIDLQLSAARLGKQETEHRKQAIADAALQHIRSLPSVAELGDQTKVLLACDTPSHTILQLAEEKQPDLVVMGTISRGGIAGMLVGNTAEKLLYKLDCSLLTVKPKDFPCPLTPEDDEAGG